MRGWVLSWHSQTLPVTHLHAWACGHDSESIFQMFSQTNMPVTFPGELEKDFSIHFSISPHTALEMSLR